MLLILKLSKMLVWSDLHFSFCYSDKDQVIIKGLEDASPPIIPLDHLQTFIDQVFGNLNQILLQHQYLLAELFERQREQHPLVHSVADIILDGKFYSL